MNNISQSRILYLLKWLNEETDEAHPIGCLEILNRWAEIGAPTDRRSVYKDIATLKELGYPIKSLRREQNYYYLIHKQFDISELKLLIDAVESSHIIPKKDTEQLVKKIAGFARKEERSELSRPLIIDKAFKNTNPEAMINIDLLYHAIRKRKKVAFQYYDYLPNKKKTLRHNNMTYIISPYFLKWSRDKYYVIGYSDDHNNISHFRVDRMTNIQILDITSQKKPEGFNPQKYATCIFGMYSTNLQLVTLLCSNERMKDIVDKFGNSARSSIVDSNHFKVTVEIEPSPPFFGWVFQFAGEIKIVEPKALQQTMMKMIRMIEK